jgi:hypothetical protein
MKTGSLVGSRRVEDTSQDEVVRMIVSGSAEPVAPVAREPMLQSAAG